jgi:uncharacterized protein YbaP (TraB family)
MRVKAAHCALTLIGLLLAAGPAAADPALWRISDSDSEIYLFGTVHILPPELEWQTPALIAAFDQAETVWFEAPANDPEGQLQNALLMVSLGMNPAGQALSSQLSPEGREALAAFAESTGMPLAALEPMRPWLAAVTLTATYVQAQGYDPLSGVEARLWPLARERGKEIDYFETIEQQVRFFADLPKEVEVGLFEQTLLEYNGASDLLDSLVGAWQEGNVTEIDRLINGEMRAEAPEIYEVVITRRNQAWVGRIQELLEGSGTHFIALGAGHMAGGDGVVGLLRARGVEVAGP